MLYTGYVPLHVKTISLDQSLTVSVLKHNIQVSAIFPISIIWNVIITSYIFTKDTGFNLLSIHFKISFKIYNIQHDRNTNSVLNYGLSPQVSFVLNLTSLKRRTRNTTSLPLWKNSLQNTTSEVLLTCKGQNCQKKELQCLLPGWSSGINPFSPVCSELQ